jgi:hypothetical protein
MTPLTIWLTRWQLTAQAVTELYHLLGVGAPTGPPPPPGSPSGEAAVQSAVRLEHARRTSGRLFRNNSGVATAENGAIVRYGLCNESKQINAICKSSDLIGITPVRCACGHTYGVFTALEVKAVSWKFRQSDKRAVAQLAFIKLIISKGGIAKFIQSVEEL